MYKNDGLKITTFENKPFADFLIENYPNGKPKTWITITMANYKTIIFG